VNVPVQATTDETRAARLVFVSYATADRKEALAVCKAVERRGLKCWISCRDVPPGENYQEAIVRAIRAADAMVLVFSEAANNSDEIKKELSLASKHHVPLMALRIEDVEPSDAFAYELSTRQWIDAFESWDRSIDSLVRHIKQVASAESRPASQSALVPQRPPSAARRRQSLVAAAVALVLVIGAAAWWALRPGPAAPHSMMVRLTGFSDSSGGLPAGTQDAMRDEIIAAFNDDGVVGVSTAAAPPPGTAPAYALGGTVRRDGDKIKVNVRLTNERSGATLWSNMFSYDADQLPRIPRRIAIDAGNMMRCGLFGASTYRKTLSDPVLTDYLQFCHNSGEIQWEPGKALVSASKVVAAAPDFSWGWSALAFGASSLASQNPDGPRAAEYRKQAMAAADKAIALDDSNSEALDSKGALQDPRDLIAREKYFKDALAARPLACGCEHHIYGLFLQSVGRNAAAIDEYRRSTDVLALDFDSQLALGDALLIAGKTDEAKTHFDAAIDLSRVAAPRDEVAIYESAVTGDYAAALKAIQNPKVEAPAPVRAALQAGFQAMISHDPAAKARAVQMLTALPPEMQNGDIASLLGALGANRAAMQVVAELMARYRLAPASWLFLPATRGVLSDPGFPAFAQSVGLMKYWKTTHSRPDVCSGQAPPPFCRMI
jgi:tetratricopeptide (TPR) repeat protein